MLFSVVSQWGKRPDFYTPQCLFTGCKYLRASQVALVVKNLSASAGDARDAGSIPGPGGGHGNPLQYSCLENPMDVGARCASVHGATKSWT